MSLALEVDSRTGALHGSLVELRATLGGHGKTLASAPGKLRRAVDAARRPVCRLVLTRGGREAYCWMDAEAAALLVHDGNARGRLLGLAAGVATSTIADLCELGPRPHASAGSSNLVVAALARAVAEANLDESTTRAPLGPAADPAFVASLGGLRAHWRVTSEWLGSAIPRTQVLEVLDTEAGLWSLHSVEDRVRVEPSTSAEIWRALNALIPRPRSGADGQARGVAR